MTTEQVVDRDTASAVVSKALVNAANELGLNGCRLSRITGMSEATISRVRRGMHLVAPETKSYEIAIILIRIHRALMSILGQDVNSARSWMKTRNKELKAVPADKMEDIRGLVAVLAYLETHQSNA